MTTIFRLTTLPVERKDIEHLSENGLQCLTEDITTLARLWITEETPSTAELTISGYDDDPRELYEIPEVCRWAKEIIKEFPVLLFFLKDTSIDRFITWISGPLSRQEIVSPEFLKKHGEMKAKYCFEAIAEAFEFFARIGVDKATVWNFYLQIIGWQEREKIK